MATQFRDKSVIITGAGKGIGRACAIEMAARGADVIALARTESDLSSLSEETGCRTIKADLLDNAAARAAVREAGTCDFLINCAGTNVLESVLEMTEEGYEAVMGINLRAALICAQEFARARVAAGGGGAILNVTSIAGHRGFDEHMCYAASKAGLEGATRVMAKELGQHGIRVNAVAPTVTMTELAAAAWSDPAKKDPMMVRHPLGRFAEVEDVAKSIVMLLSDDAPMVTGAVLPIDGGFLAV
jgi:NAD(P)-dependent dehydrogenase (short-subunit alcohol dehydrogenase family)